LNQLVDAVGMALLEAFNSGASYTAAMALASTNLVTMDG
jgi:hypothetical protein